MTDTRQDNRLVQRIAEAVQDAGKLLDQLQMLLPEADETGPSTGTMHAAPESRPPWNEAAANAYTTIWQGAHNVARTMAYELGISTGDLGHGWTALSRIANFAPSVTEWTAKYVVHQLERWVDVARQIPAIDESEPWVPVPAAPGCLPPKCPFCGTFALRMQRRRGLVRCFLPGCHDGDQHPTRARMEPGRMTGEARLVFGDGTMQHWQETA
jgi:hypothetical protein